LIKAGCDVTKADKNGLNALHFAGRLNFETAKKKLYKAKKVNKQINKHRHTHTYTHTNININTNKQT
jgi:hypothetical protein